MVFKDFARTVREQWLLIVATVVVVCTAAGVVWFIRPVEYSTQLTMYVSAQTADTAPTAYQGGLLAQQRVASYVELVDSPRVTSPVIAILGLPQGTSELATHITATTEAESVLINITVTDVDPERVTAIANTIGAVLRQLVEDLERPVTSAAIPPVALRIVQPAQLPTAPSSPALPFALILGAVAGLALGLAIALARSKLDTSIKRPEQLSAAAQVSVLETIPYDKKVFGRPDFLHENPSSAVSEAFRRLRTSLQFANVDGAHKAVVVTSPLPAEGRTTTLCNLAVATASVGKRVLVIDGDLRRSTLARFVGVDNSVGLTDVLTGSVGLDRAVQRWEGGGLDVLVGGVQTPNPSELLASREMHALLKNVREVYDVVLVDSPPLLAVTDGAVLAAATDGAILVCRVKTVRGDVQDAREALNAASASLLGAVLTLEPSSGRLADGPHRDSRGRLRRWFGRAFGGRPRGPAEPAGAVDAGHLPEPPRTLHDDGAEVPEEPTRVVGNGSSTRPIPSAVSENGAQPLEVDTPADQGPGAPTPTSSAG